jgi:undecaprenyl diphosphate synthase
MSSETPHPRLAELQRDKLPQHVAIIMDGNGRWAKQRGGLRIFGHRSALGAVRECTELCTELGIGYLTLYTFSEENWNRPKLEVRALMELLVETIRKETPDLHRNNVRVNTIGHIGRLPERAQRELRDAIATTAQNTGLVLTLALSYGSRQDILDAVRNICQQVQQGAVQPDEVTERLISANLSTAGMPDPELLIRTSGEHRISNFLLWEIAYSEIYFTPKLWPDFRKNDLVDALLDYQRRERRFGLTSEQLAPQPS